MSVSSNRRFRAEWILIGVGLVLMFFFWWRLPTGELHLLRNTLQLGICAMLIAMPIAAALAYLLGRFRVPGRTFWEASLLILLFMPLYIQLASWEAGFGRGGWYSLRIAQQLSDPPLDGFRGAVWVHAMAAVPWLFWILRIGLQNIPRTYEDAASLDARPLQVFRHLIVPLALPAFVAGGLYVLVVTATEITVTDRYQFRSYAEVLYNEFVLNTRFDALPLGVAPIVLHLVVAFLVGIAICRLLWPALVHATVHPHPTATRKSRGWAWAIVAATVGVLLFVPIGNLLYQAGIDVRQVGDHRERLWSLSKVLRICFHSPVVYAHELAWTALLAQLSTVAALAVATGFSWYGMHHGWCQAAGTVLAILGFVTPGPFIGLGLIWLLNRESPAFLGFLYADTIFAPWLALTLRCFPFAFLIILVGFKSIPQSILDASRADGANSWRSLFHVALPIIRPSLIGAAVVSLAVCVGELSASVLLLPPGVSTVSSRIFHLIHYGAEDELAGLCLSCVAMMVGFSLVARGVFQRLGVRVR